MTIDQTSQKAMNQSHLMSVDMAEKIDMSIHLPQKQTKIDSPRHSFMGRSMTKRKELRFANLSTLILTQPKTAPELASSWYNKHEIYEFKNDIKKKSQALCRTPNAHVMAYIGRCIQTGDAQAELVTYDAEEIRGLKHLLSPEICRVLVQSRKAVIVRVLQEQARQEEVGSYDAEKIASLSLASSEFAKEWRRRIMVL